MFVVVDDLRRGESEGARRNSEGTRVGHVVAAVAQGDGARLGRSWH